MRFMKLSTQLIDSIAIGKFDGIHLGQEDIRKIDNDISKAVDSIKTQFANKIIGISTHNEDEIYETNNCNIDYIGLGAYRQTGTKQDISTIIGEKASYLASLSKHPVGLIGGVLIDDNVSNISYNVIGSGLMVEGIKYE